MRSRDGGVSPPICYKKILGALGGAQSVRHPTLSFGSGREIEPRAGFRSGLRAGFRLCSGFSPSASPARALALSKINQSDFQLHGGRCP